MIYAFETYTLDTDRYELRRAGILCPLEPHALDMLAYLLAHRIIRRLEPFQRGKIVGFYAQNRRHKVSHLPIPLSV